MDHDAPEITPAKTRGRKRDPARTNVILEAAARQLLEVGYDRFRIQDVAKRAGSGTGAIYRRWSSKEALVAEAIANLPPSPIPLTGDPVDDLRKLVRRLIAEHAQMPDRFPGLISAMRADPRIRDALVDNFTVKPYRDAVARVIGADHPHLDLLAELAPGVSLLRTTLAPDRLEPDALSEEIVQLVVSLAPAD